MQMWEWDALPIMLRPPFSPAALCAKRATLIHEVLTMMVEDLEVDTPAQIAIMVAHMLDLGETLCQMTRAEVGEDDSALGEDEEEAGDASCG